MARRIASVVLAAALLGLLAFVAPSGGATNGETCTHVSGAALFQPPLPKIGNNTKVPFVIVTKAMTLYTCSGPGGAVGTVALTVKSPTKTNCRLLSGGGAPTTSGTGTIKWAKGKPSTIAVKFTFPRNSLSPLVTGTVVAGQFKGFTVSTTLALAVDVRMCAAQPLSRATIRFAKGSKFVIDKPVPPTSTTTTSTSTTSTSTTTSTTMPAAAIDDLNHDGMVDCADLAVLNSEYGTTAPNQPGDLNHDGKVDIFDLSIFASNFPAGVSCDPPTTTTTTP